jgi:hypothetical protein
MLEVALAAKRLQQTTDLVWTGPATSVVPVRSTEQVLSDLINNSGKKLTIMSFGLAARQSHQCAFPVKVGSAEPSRLLVPDPAGSDFVRYNHGHKDLLITHFRAQRHCVAEQEPAWNRCKSAAPSQDPATSNAG